MKWLRRLWARMRTRLSGKGNPFELSETVEAVVSPMELQIYRIDADRNGLDLATWLRTTLNAGVSASTLKHLSKGRGNQNVVDMAKSKSKYMDKVSGHPCRHLNPDLPKNMTRAECSGSCKSSMRGYGGRPCFWSSLAAKNCDAFQPKTNPTTPTRKR
jgi:hypothetical protein